MILRPSDGLVRAAYAARVPSCLVGVLEQHWTEARKRAGIKHELVDDDVQLLIRIMVAKNLNDSEIGRRLGGSQQWIWNIRRRFNITKNYRKIVNDRRRKDRSPD